MEDISVLTSRTEYYEASLLEIRALVVVSDSASLAEARRMAIQTLSLDIGIDLSKATRIRMGLPAKSFHLDKVDGFISYLKSVSYLLYTFSFTERFGSFGGVV